MSMSSSNNYGYTCWCLSGSYKLNLNRFYHTVPKHTRSYQTRCLHLTYQKPCPTLHATIYKRPDTQVWSSFFTWVGALPLSLFFTCQVDFCFFGDAVYAAASSCLLECSTPGASCIRLWPDARILHHRFPHFGHFICGDERRLLGVSPWKPHNDCQRDKEFEFNEG